MDTKLRFVIFSVMCVLMISVLWIGLSKAQSVGSSVASNDCSNATSYEFGNVAVTENAAFANADLNTYEADFQSRQASIQASGIIAIQDETRIATDESALNAMAACTANQVNAQ